MLPMVHKGTLSAKDVLEEWAKQAMPLPDLEIDLGRLLEIKEDEPDRLMDVDAGGLNVKVHIDRLIEGKRNEINTLFEGLQNCSQALYEAHDRLQTFNPLRDKVAVDWARSRWSASHGAADGHGAGGIKEGWGSMPQPALPATAGAHERRLLLARHLRRRSVLQALQCALGHRRRRDRAAAAGSPSQDC